tara:strand:+ start:1119 stop:2180 length:1062 start_codon:yes stop_codon:yes gene_type:complete
MKILICSDGKHAHYYQRMAWANAFQSCGFDVAFWDKNAVTAFDVFDDFEPDIFLGQSYNLDEATVKCIYERPHLKVGLRAGDWGDHAAIVDKDKYNILFCSPKEREILKKLKDETGQPEFVHIHYTPEAINWTHNYFATIGIRATSLMMCADVKSYSQGQSKPELECELGFVGGYWPYKGQVINKYFMPLLNPIGNYKIKIFGNQPWPANQYCGFIHDDQVKDLFCSAKICPNLSEPHAQEFGVDVNERIFKILYAGGFCISDNVDGYRSIFGDSVPLADSPKHFKELIDHYLANPEERQELSTAGQQIVQQNHTSFHRAAQILSEFGFEQESGDIISSYEDYLFEKNYGLVL